MYVLHKSAAVPFVEMGCVECVNNFMPYYGMNSIPMNISVKVGEKVTPYQNLPPNAEVADATNSATGETITIACTKEALNAELQSMKQKSIDIINSVEYHKQRIEKCDALLQQINPEEAEKAAQAKEVCELRSQVSDLSKMVADLLKLQGGEASSLKEGGTRV